MSQFIDIFLHLDTHLSNVILAYGGWTYSILFLVVFCETGLIILPFLPGDSLLFAAGAFAGRGDLHLTWLWGMLTVAAIVGDTVNYFVGYHAGKKVLDRWEGRILKREHIDRTQAFYNKHGGKTIILARFIPIIRTFAPFVAGIAKMKYSHFVAYNVVGGMIWVTIFLLGGYFFGNIPIIRDNFTLVIFAVIGVSIMPGIIRLLQHQYALYRAGQR